LLCAALLLEVPHEQGNAAPFTARCIRTHWPWDAEGQSICILHTTACVNKRSPQQSAEQRTSTFVGAIAAQHTARRRTARVPAPANGWVRRDALTALEVL